MRFKVVVLIVLVGLWRTAGQDLSPLRLRGLKGGDYRGGAEYKIHAAINDVRDAIDDAAGGSKPTTRATATGSNLANAAIDSSISEDAMIAMGAGQGTRRLSNVDAKGREGGGRGNRAGDGGMHGENGMHREGSLYAGSAAVSDAISSAASGAITAKAATRIGDDVGHIITHPMTPFGIDHDPDLRGQRKLQREIGDDDSGLVASMHTSEAIANLGAKAAPMGTLQAAAAGFHGSSYLGDLLDSKAHRWAVEKPSVPRKLLAA